jgi:hypothetical protein
VEEEKRGQAGSASVEKKGPGDGLHTIGEKRRAGVGLCAAVQKTPVAGGAVQDARRGERRARKGEAGRV